MTFKFEHGQPVIIKPTEYRATVVWRRELFPGRNDYMVCWWAEGKRCEECVYEFELMEVGQ